MLSNNSTRIVLVQSPLAAGQGDSNSNSVDMQSFDGVCFVGICGTIAEGGAASLQAEVGDDSSSFTALPAITANAAANKFVLLDIYKPMSRYIRTKLARADANVVWGGTIAILYDKRVRPATHDALTLAAQVLAVAPDHA
jgi:hypothetical protein